MKRLLTVLLLAFTCTLASVPRAEAKPAGRHFWHHHHRRHHHHHHRHHPRTVTIIK
jgi:hypothetical protein